jgi:hypothetical protein
MTIITNNQGRSILGTGGVLNTHHEGYTKNPTEDKAFSSLEKQSLFPVAKFKKETPMNNPGFMGTVEPSEKKG